MVIKVGHPTGHPGHPSPKLPLASDALWLPFAINLNYLKKNSKKIILLLDTPLNAWYNLIKK